MSKSRDEFIPRERIERRAYELYVERGREDGKDLQDWFAAEQELRTKYDSGDVPPKRSTRSVGQREGKVRGGVSRSAAN